MSAAMIGPKFYGFGKDGTPLAFGKLYTYQARTNAPKDTYQSEDQEVANTNPVILNGEGYANVYLDGSYKVVLKDSDDNEIWSADPVTAQVAEEWINCLAATYLSPTSFSVTGNHAAEFDTGRRLRIDSNTAEYTFATISTSSYSGGVTTVVVIGAVPTGIVTVCTSIVGSESLDKQDSVLNQLTLAEAVADTAAFDGAAANLKERTTGNGGGAMWDYVLASSVTTNTFNIVACTGDASLALVLRVESIVNISQFGALGDGSNDDALAMQSAIDYAAERGYDVQGSPNKVYNHSVGLVLGKNYPSDKKFIFDMRSSTLHAVNSFTQVTCITGSLINCTLTTNADKGLSTTIGIKIGDYPTYALTNYSRQSIKGIVGGSEFYRLITSEIELDNTIIDDITYFKSVGDAVISITEGNPVDTSRSAGLQLTRLWFSNPDKDGDYSSATPDTGLRLRGTEDCRVTGIINSYDITIDTEGSSGGTRNNRNLDLRLHRDGHDSDAAKNGSLFVGGATYSTGDYVYPTVDSSAVGYVFKCSVGGVADPSEPVWGLTHNSTTVSGAVSFVNVAYMVNYSIGNDVDVNISEGRNSIDNCGILTHADATVNVQHANLSAGRGVLLKIISGTTSFFTSTGVSLEGQFDDSADFFLYAGTKIKGFLSYAEQRIGSSISSETSATRKVNAKIISADYTTTIEDEYIYVETITADITITVNNGTKGGQMIKVVNSQTAFRVKVRSTNNFIGTLGVDMQTEGAFADVMVVFLQKCVISSNIAVI